MTGSLALYRTVLGAFCLSFCSASPWPDSHLPCLSLVLSALFTVSSDCITYNTAWALLIWSVKLSEHYSVSQGCRYLPREQNDVIQNNVWHIKTAWNNTTYNFIKWTAVQLFALVVFCFAELHIHRLWQPRLISREWFSMCVGDSLGMHIIFMRSSIILWRL